MDWQKWQQAGELLEHNRVLIASKQEQLQKLETLFIEERKVLSELQKLEREIQHNSDVIDRLQHEMQEE